jgi:hypothetical protein
MREFFVLRWLARLSGLAVAGGFVALAIGEMLISPIEPTLKTHRMDGHRSVDRRVRRDADRVALGTARGLEKSLPDARGSDRSRDREGAEALEYAMLFLHDALSAAAT